MVGDLGGAPAPRAPDVVAPDARPMRRAALVTVALVVYLPGLLFLYGLLGPGSAVLALLLPAAAGALFGLRVGVIGALLSLLLTAAMWQLVGFRFGDVMLRSGNGLGALAVLAVGAGFGAMRDLRRRVEREREALRGEIARRERAEAGMRAGESLLQTVLRSVPVVLLAVDRKLDLVLSGGKGLAALGLTPGDAVGRSARVMYRDHPQVLANLERALAGEDLTDTVAAGDLAYEVRYTPLRDEVDAVIGAVGVAADVTERRRAERDLERLALYDPLTALPNRTLFRDRLDHALRSAQRAEAPCALLLLDLDRFKEVNNTFGHAIGDELLRRVGQTLDETLRRSNTLARLGGDEFGVVLHGASAASAARVAQRLRKALERPFAVNEHAVDLAASIGIAVYPEHGEDGEALLAHAEIAMYVAKGTDAGYAVYAAAQDEYSPSRLALVPQLREAIRTDALLLHYQPIVRIADGMPLALEALARWPHPEQGLIAPGLFVPLAERTGLMRPLTDWVLDAALRQCAAWRDAGCPHAVSVNISMRNLVDPDFAGSVAGVLHAHGVEASQLRLEITESVIMADPERAMGTLARLHKMGARIDIDDFGTGYSSLAYLHRLPVDAVKIDRSFIGTMRTDEGSATIVRSIIGLGHDLGLKVVAEGVEDRDTSERLAELGCDALQGYYLTRPGPPAEILRCLEAVR